MARTTKTPKKKATKENPTPSWTTSETRGCIFISLSILLLLSLTSFASTTTGYNLLGIFGYTIGWLFHALFGLSSYLFVPFFVWLGWRLLFNKAVNLIWLKSLYLGLAIVSLSILLSIIEDTYPAFSQAMGSYTYPGLWLKKQRFHLGGAPFYYIYNTLPGFNLHRILNTTGAALIFSSTLAASIIFLFKIRLSPLFLWIYHQIKKDVLEKQANDQKKSEAEESVDTIKPNKTEPSNESDFLRFVKLRIPNSNTQESSSKNGSQLNSGNELLGIQPEKNLKMRPSISRKEMNDTHDHMEPEEQTSHSLKNRKQSPLDIPPDVENKEPGLKKKRDQALIAQSIHNGDFTNYIVPSPNLLSNPKKVDQSTLKKDLKRRAEVLEETLLSFGIEAKVGQINCGPTITSFEVHPAIGVKVQKIKTLDNDIALNMEAKSIRIIAPIPGKAAVGIEVPNPQPQEVGFKDMLLAYQQGTQKFHIPILLGKAVNGDYVMNDLAKMPHCIIAGATGSGKSVCINTIVMSILLNAKPDQVKLIMVDPKKVELTQYSNLPHMLAPVITEPKGAAAALNWLVKEMENRYDILKLVGLRNIESFNKRTIDVEREAALGREIPAFMPYIVGIIDELADLMMVASQDIETPIARIAQMARAVGIHLILATQRPSREVITGIIKANFPTRISFKVASRVNSQIVLDETGAESLLGNGDMLFLPPGSSHLTRAQGAFIRDEDIQSVVQKICEQAPPRYVIESFDRMIETSGSGEDIDHKIELDALYEQALEVILGTGNASTTFLQRKLKIGYARAASLMDQLEANGVVGPAEGSKPRKIFGKKPGLPGEEDRLEEFLEEELV